jgi:hypothetical protein
LNGRLKNRCKKLDGQEEKQGPPSDFAGGTPEQIEVGKFSKPIANFAVEATGSSTDLDSITKKNYVELCSQKCAY